MTLQIEYINNITESISLLNFSSIPAVQTTSKTDVAVVIFRIGLYSSFYYVGLIFPFGLVFNILLLIVFGVSPLRTTETTRVYYLAMAYAELVTVFFKDGYLFWASFGLPFVTGGLNPLGFLNPLSHLGNPECYWMCSVHGFVWYTHEMLANYAFLLFELERVVAVYSPFRVHRLFTLRVTLITVYDFPSFL